MNTRIISKTEDGMVIAAIAAKLTHEPDRSHIEELSDMCWDPECGQVSAHGAKVLRHCIQMGHESVLEHAKYTFYVEDISRALTHQLVRHRIASFSQQSQRYVNMEDGDFIMPELDYIKDDMDREMAKIKFKEFFEISKEYYKVLSKSYGVRKEDARAVLPNACPTKILITMNVRELRHFFKLRIHPHAQSEIREMASQMLYLANISAPIFFEDLLADEFIKENLNNISRRLGCEIII